MRAITCMTILCLPLWALSQTVNTGEMYIASNTQFGTLGAFDNTVTGEFFNDGEAFIYSHFNNDGTVDFTSGKGGYTRFQGTAVQQLSGGNISYFYDVLFDNAANNEASFELMSEISVDNEARFEQGIVNDDDFGGLAIFENKAFHTGTHNGSHVDGMVQKNGDTSFEYPIGDSGFYRYAAIGAPNGANNVFTGKYFFENPGISYPLANHPGVIVEIDNQEYWTITRDFGNGEVLLTLSWDENTTTPYNIVSDTEAIHIVRWDEAQQLWVSEGGIVDAANKTVTTPIALEDYGVFTLAKVKKEFVLPPNVVVYNALSANGNDKNDYFRIDNIQDLPNNRVEVYNRWGIKVFETTDYDTWGNVFDGHSQGRMTLNEKEMLPAGTYFYVLSYDYDNGEGMQRVKQSGFLYLNVD